MGHKKRFGQRKLMHRRAVKIPEEIDRLEEVLREVLVKPA